ARCPCSRLWSRRTSSGSHSSPCRASSPRARSCSARATRATPATSSTLIALGRRLRETNERLQRQSFSTVQSRVAVVLSQLVEQELTDGSRGDVLVTATQADLAQLAGSSRESASRFLAVLERAGVISQGRGRLTVHDPEALKQYVF